MKITAGALKGRRLFVPPGYTVRPTSDKVREALFNILSDRIKGASFLDLYAGSGAVGLEAISRGADRVVFVENNKRHLDYLRKNIGAYSLQERAKVFPVAAADFLKKMKPGPFDFIFIDPPYQSQELEKTLPRVAAGDIITESGVVIVEHFHKKILPEKIGNLGLLRRYPYGNTVLSFYVKA